MEEQKKNPAQGLSESEQVQVRRQKLADLQAAGHDPFTLTKYPQDAYSADLKEEFKDLPNESVFAILASHQLGILAGMEHTDNQIRLFLLTDNLHPFAGSLLHIVETQPFPQIL